MDILNPFVTLDKVTALLQMTKKGGGGLEVEGAGGNVSSFMNAEDLPGRRSC